MVVLGDVGRDSGRWGDAVQNYALAVSIKPMAVDIWVQLGHAYKESGNFVHAEAAYMRAFDLRPTDSDLLVQLGHLHAARINSEKALNFYQRAFEAGSKDEHVIRYLRRFRPLVVVDLNEAYRSALPEIYLEYTDLLNHFRHNRNPTGIQRVQIELFRASLVWNSPVPIYACAFAGPQRGWVSIDLHELAELIDLAYAPGGFHDPVWQDALAGFMAGLESAPGCPFQIGTVLINIGTAWGLEGYMSEIRSMKRRYGLRYVPLVFDLIPLVVSEYVDAGVAPAFNSWFSSAVLHSDLFAVISLSTGRDVIKAALMIRDLAYSPIAMLLDTAPDSAQADMTKICPAQVLSSLDLEQGAFVLFVGTIEARKSHRLVFQAWQQLIDDNGKDGVPILVCVGKLGWKYESALNFLEAHPDTNDKVRILSGISDAELVTLYQGCLFTVYASYYEGWGLPVTESLYYGKACLTANHSSLPEAGTKFADYYESDSVKSFANGAQRLIFDPAHRRTRENLIANEFKPRTWHDALEGLVTDIGEYFKAPTAPQALCAPVDAGTLYFLGNGPFWRGLDRGAAIAEMLRFDNAWYGIDSDCVWSRGAWARLGFQLPSSIRSDFLVFLKVCASLERTVLSVHLADAVLHRITMQPNEDHTIRVDIPFSLVEDHVRNNTPVTLSLHTSTVVALHKYEPGNPRTVGIGVKMFMACAADDVDARVTVLEQILMTLENAQ